LSIAERVIIDMQTRIRSVAERRNAEEIYPERRMNRQKIGAKSGTNE